MQNSTYFRLIQPLDTPVFTKLAQPLAPLLFQTKCDKMLIAELPSHRVVSLVCFKITLSLNPVYLIATNCIWPPSRANTRNSFMGDACKSVIHTDEMPGKKSHAHLRGQASVRLAVLQLYNSIIRYFFHSVKVYKIDL